MRLFQAPLDTCLDSPFFASLSVHGLHFTVCELSSIYLGTYFFRSFPKGRKIENIQGLPPRLKTSSEIDIVQENSRRLWRSQRRKSSSVPEGKADFPAAMFLAESAQSLAGTAFRAAGKSVKNFPAASKFAGKLVQQGFRTATAFSSVLNLQASHPPKPFAFVGEIQKVEIEFFKRDWSFQARLKFSKFGLLGLVGCTRRGSYSAKGRVSAF